MSVPAAYIGVILIWSTTPLGIKWSSEGGILFAATARMVIGAALCVMIFFVLRKALPRDRIAMRAYFAASIGAYGSMMCIYWGAQHVASGLISVLFGLAPISAGLFARIWLGDRQFTPLRAIGTLISVGGLAVIFADALHGAELLSVAAILCGVLLYSLSAVAVKRTGSTLSALSLATGSLLLVVPMYAVTFWIVGAAWPQALSGRASISIIYLGVMGSVVGFMLYFYVLKRIDMGRLAMINIITPVAALAVGALFNDEHVNRSIWIGTFIIMGGLAVFEWEALRRTFGFATLTPTLERNNSPPGQ